MKKKYLFWGTFILITEGHAGIKITDSLQSALYAAGASQTLTYLRDSSSSTVPPHLESSLRKFTESLAALKKSSTTEDARASQLRELGASLEATFAKTMAGARPMSGPAPASPSGSYPVLWRPSFPPSYSPYVDMGQWGGLPMQWSGSPQNCGLPSGLIEMVYSLKLSSVRLAFLTQEPLNKALYWATPTVPLDMAAVVSQVLQGQYGGSASTLQAYLAGLGWNPQTSSLAPVTIAQDFGTSSRVDLAFLQRALTYFQQNPVNVIISLGGYISHPLSQYMPGQQAATQEDANALFHHIAATYPRAGWDFDIENAPPLGSTLEQWPSLLNYVLTALETYKGSLSPSLREAALTYDQLVAFAASDMPIPVQRLFTAFKTLTPVPSLSLTFPVGSDGTLAGTALNDAAKAIIQYVAAQEIAFTVNLMTMDYNYADSFSPPDPMPSMAAYAAAAATNTAMFLRNIYSDQTVTQLLQKVQITPMFGVNDKPTDQPALLFTPEDAQQLAVWAQAFGVTISGWALNRDYPFEEGNPRFDQSSNSTGQSVDHQGTLYPVQRLPYLYSQVFSQVHPSVRGRFDVSPFRDPSQWTYTPSVV